MPARGGSGGTGGQGGVGGTGGIGGDGGHGQFVVGLGLKAGDDIFNAGDQFGIDLFAVG